MLVVSTATSPDGRISHHLVRADSASNALRRLRPLLPPETRIDTLALHWWRTNRGRLPDDLLVLDEPTERERELLKDAGSRIVTKIEDRATCGPRTKRRAVL